MLEGINDSIKDAKELVKLIKPLKAKINLIPFNPRPGSNYKASSPDQIKVFKKFILDEGKLVATVRLPRGDDVLAACGQLKSLKGLFMKKVVLAYSGGLDTSVILKWLQIEKKLDVIAFIVILGRKMN